MEEEQQPQPVMALNIVDSLMSMHREEREAMFKLFTENRELFNKMIPNNLFLDVVADPATEVEHPLIKHYQYWARVQATPK
jgi:hypothetical protein